MRPVTCKLLFSALLCAFLICCKTQPSVNNIQTSVSEGIRKQLQSGATRIDMKGVATDFAWDKLYVFTPYYPKDEMCKKVGVSPQQCPKTHLKDADEGEFLLVFMQAGEITHIDSFSRINGNFDESERCAALPIGIGKAIFNVEQRNGLLLVCE